MEKKKKYGVQKEVLKLRTKKEYLALRKLTHLSKNMYNAGLYSVRQHFFETGRFLTYKDNYHECKSNENYKMMGTAAAQQTLKKVEENFKSFFGLLGIKSKDARIPKYLEKDGFFELSYPQFKMQKDGTFNVPMSHAFKKEHGNINIRFPSNLSPEDVAEIRIIPKYNAHYFEIEYVYEIKEVKHGQLSKNEALSIDLGIDNFASCLDTLGNSFLIDGKRIKSANQWYNKENARLQSIKDKQGIRRLTNRQVCLLRKRNNILRDFLNKTTHYIVKHCLDNGIGKVVIGHNKGWKDKCNMGRNSNQKFVQIPHSLLISKIESMCERYGIEFLRQEESYTSQSSFLDNDPLPVYGEDDQQAVFTGRRVSRGLFHTFKSVLLNADLNGAANILRKCTHTSALAGKVARGLLAVPVRIKLV